MSNSSSSYQSLHSNATFSTDSLPPDYPYLVGRECLLTPHVPAPPPEQVCEISFSDFVDDGWDHSHQKQYCAARLPTAGTSIKDSCMTVRITEDVRTGDYKNAQIVVMNENKIAKIHDPVYYAHKFYEGGRIKVLIDVVHAADKDFYREASAYAELQGTDAEGTVIPRYYGSWTMEVHDEKGLPRTVALVLIEYIRGSCMRDVDVKALTQAHREDVVAKVLEADILLKHNGVCHRDLHPRNVIFSLLDSTGPLSPTDFSSPDLRITIIDFNMAKLSRLEGYEIGKLEGKKMDNPAWIHGSNISWAQYAGWLTKEDVTNHA